MSYILDALKKSEEERERGTVPKLTTRLFTEAATKRRVWPWVVGGALLANAAVLGVFLLPSDEPPAGVGQETAAETPAAKPAEPAASTESKTATAKPPPAKPKPEATAAEPAAAEAAAPAAEPAAAEPLPKLIVPPRRPAEPAPVKAAPTEIRVVATTPTPEPAMAPAESAPEPKPMPPDPAPVVVAAQPEPVKAEPPAPKKTVVVAVPPVKPEPKPQATEKIESPAPKKIGPLVVATATAADPSDAGYAVAYYNRGWGYAGKRLFNQAVEDYTQAIRLKKEYAAAYFARGWVYEKQDQIDLALKDYTRAIEIKPNHALAYNNRGVLQLHRNLYDEATDDFTTAFTLADKDLRPYVLLWLHLSRIRSGSDGKPELIEYAKKLDLRRWPGVVVSMFLGEASAETVIADTKDEDPAKQKEKECVAFYFLGQQKLLEGDTDEAEAFFRRTVETGVASYVQYGAAQAELRRMGAS